MSATSMAQRKDAVVGMLTPLLGRLVRQESFSLPADVGNGSRALVVDSGDLTELLFFAPVIKHLKHRFPALRITALVREGNSELIRTMDQINELISYEPEHLSLASTTYFSLLRRLKARDFDVVFLLGKEFNLARSLVALATRARVRVGYTSRHTYPFLNCEIRPGDGMRYEGPRSLGFLGALGLSPGDAIPGWALPEQDARWASQMIHFRKPEKGTRLLAVDPGMGKGEHRLVDQSLAYMVDKIAERHCAQALILSNNLDAKGLERFRGMLSCDLVDLRPKSLKEALALLSRADLVLAGNTDFFHFAVSMRLPTLGFFTRYDASNWFPKGTPWVQIIQGVKGQKLSLDEVFSKIDTLLKLSGA